MEARFLSQHSLRTLTKDSFSSSVYTNDSLPSLIIDTTTLLGHISVATFLMAALPIPIVSDRTTTRVQSGSVDTTNLSRAKSMKLEINRIIYR